MTSNRQQVTSEKKPSGLPRWLMITWFIVFPPAFLLIARFVYEQTYLTWAQGLQMVGFTLAKLAKMIGTSESVISRLEDSEYTGHSLTMLKRIAEAVDKRVEIRFVPRNEKLQPA